MENRIATFIKEGALIRTCLIRKTCTINVYSTSVADMRVVTKTLNGMEWDGMERNGMGWNGTLRKFPGYQQKVSIYGLKGP